MAPRRPDGVPGRRTPARGDRRGYTGLARRLGFATLLTTAFIALDVLLFFGAIVALIRVRRRILFYRERFGDSWLAAETAVANSVGSLAARLIVGEPKAWVAIAMWVSHRTPKGPDVFAYAAASRLGVVFVVVLLLIAVEGIGGAIISRLVPWPWLTLLLLAVSAYAALWILGIYAALRAFPHRVTVNGLIARYGLLAEAWIAWDAVDSAKREVAASPGGQDGLSIHADVAAIAVGGKTQVSLKLSTPTMVKGFLRTTPGITQVRLAAEDSDALLASIRRQMVQHGRSPAP